MSDSKFKKFNFHKGLADICFEEGDYEEAILTIQQQLSIALIIRRRLFATGDVVPQRLNNLIFPRIYKAL